MKRIFNYFINFFTNILVFFINLFIWRNKKIWLFGSWMGNKFSDNTRFLFQYLTEHKTEFGIKKVIWVTRSEEVYNSLIEIGYNDVYMMHSVKSYFYHLKSGVHIVCNNVSISRFQYDIMSNLSFGAKKIQLWHGIGIKACGIKKQATRKNFITFLYYSFFNKYFQPGMWGKCFFWAVSEEHARILGSDFGISYKKFIFGPYPRLCFMPKLTKEEIKIVERINIEKANRRIILYLPTFRENYENYLEPLSIEGFSDFLIKNNILWIQKSHSVGTFDYSDGKCHNFINLKSNFDVNIILDHIDILISDYSSVTSDAIFKNIVTIDYCPDFDYYKNLDRGFVADYDNYHCKNFVSEPNKLCDMILFCLLNKEKAMEKNEKVKKLLFDRCSSDIKISIWNIIKKINLI